MLVIQNSSFPQLYHILKVGLIAANPVNVGEWHAQSTKDHPLLVTREIQDLVVEQWTPIRVEEAQELYQPNLPWAESHFLERVGGVPLNPPPSHSEWPWAHAQHQDAAEKFSHTYPERYWPKHAGHSPGNCAYPEGWGEGEDKHICDYGDRFGIRYDYGDLGDLVAMLRRNANTRQAYLPVWFPEDTGAVHGERVPCSLGYHFMVREGKLSCRYFLRSCDFVRHFNDDVYLTVRLMQWIAEQLPGVGVGKLYMWISSLHIMEGDVAKLSRELADE